MVVRQLVGGEGDPVRIYMKEMGAVSLLTKEEEIEIAANVARFVDKELMPERQVLDDQRMPRLESEDQAAKCDEEHGREVSARPMLTAS